MTKNGAQKGPKALGFPLKVVDSCKPRNVSLYSVSGNKVFSIIQNLPPESQKNIFWFNKCFFGSKCFFTIQIQPESQKTIWFKKHFSFKMVIFAQNWSFLLIFGSFWTILAPFWAQKCFSVQKVFSGSKCFFIQIRPESQKNILNGKTILNEKCFSE